MNRVIDWTNDEIYVSLREVYTGTCAMLNIIDAQNIIYLNWLVSVTYIKHQMKNLLRLWYAVQYNDPLSMYLQYNVNSFTRNVLLGQPCGKRNMIFMCETASWTHSYTASITNPGYEIVVSTS